MPKAEQKWSSSAPLFDLASKQEKIKENNQLMEAPDFWNDQKKAQKLIRETNNMKSLVDTHTAISNELADLAEGVDELSSSFDPDMNDLIQEEYQDVMKKFSDFEIQVLLSGPYDDHNVILEIHPGAGGTEAMDWAGMLYRMYTRYAEKKGYKLTLLDYEEGEEAGVKSVTLKIEGHMAYGYLKGEAGVHRLVRISPFDANARRHTSFASVDIMPEFEDDLEIEIDPNDLEIETHRSSGAGGQHINKTDSAVRIVHKPTGITVNCQEGRSQIENRETAMAIIRSRVYEYEREKEEAKAGALRKAKIGTGDRSEKIRTYNYPQNRVTDHRIGLTITQLDRIMEGKLDGMIAGLKAEEEKRLLQEAKL